jgi:hypothetical protein
MKCLLKEKSVGFNIRERGPREFCLVGRDITLYMLKSEGRRVYVLI